MTAGQPVSTKRSRRWMIGVIVVVLLAVLFWAFDGWLLFRLNVIASDAFNTNPQAPVLVAADREELAAYTPARLAKFLTAPSTRVRTIVCLSLAERGSQADPAAWVGVVPKLLAHVDDPEETVRESARWALLLAPTIPDEDAEVVAAFAEKEEPRDGPRRQLIRALLDGAVQKHAEVLPRAAAVYRRWVASSNGETRREGFRGLIYHDAKAPETLAAFERFMAAGDPDRVAFEDGSNGDPVRGVAMVRLYPKLIDPYINGNDAQKMIVFSIAATEEQWKIEEAREKVAAEELERKRKETGKVPGGRQAPLFRPKTFTLKEDQLKRLEPFAQRLAAQKEPIEMVQKARFFLARRGKPVTTPPKQ